MRLLLVLALVACHAAVLSASPSDSPKSEQDAILAVAHPVAERMAGQPVKFRMALFNIDSDWALIFGRLVSPAGGRLDWEKAKGCAVDDDKSLIVVARKIAGQWTIKDMDICAVEPGYWHVDELETIGFPCDLYRGLDVPTGVNALQPLDQCKGYRETRLQPPEPSPSSPCRDLATEIIQSDRATPLIDRDSIERLATWRAARCEDPPIGDGRVLALCQAKTKDGGHVFYWNKMLDGKPVHGWVTCH